MRVKFIIQAWAAYSPGLSSPEDWQRWAAHPFLPGGAGVPELAEMPTMMRRRLDPMGRMAVQVAWWCQRGDLGMPVVFASRYGDATRSLAMLAEIARGEPVSPTAFGLSVHNAVAGMYSIARGDRANHLSVAAGAASAAAGLVEASALLADGAPEVMVVCYDAPLPGDYAAFHDEPAAPYAWAWRIARPEMNGACIELSAGEDAVPQEPGELPFGLDVLRFALSAEKRMARKADGTWWTLRRHD